MLAILLLLACADPAPADTDDTAPACDPQADLDAARAATEAYADIGVAMEAGYDALDEACDSDDRGAAMGVHYVRLADSMDQDLDPLQPEILLYVPEGDGMRLVGIEYVRPALVDGQAAFGETAPEGEFDPPPEMFCRPFDGPMAGHVGAQPWHYDLHVWLFSSNPDGMFAQYNPAESCEP